MTGLLFALATGLRDIRRVIGRSIALMAHVGILGLLVGLSSGLVSQSVQDIGATRRLAALDAAYLVVGDGNTDPNAEDVRRLRAIVVQTLTHGNSYSIDLSQSRGPDARVVTIYGDASSALGLKIEPNGLGPPYALAGSRSGVSGSVALHGRSIPVRGTLDNMGIVDLWMEYVPLDDAVVVVGDIKDDVDRLSDSQLADIASRMVLVRPSADELASYLAAARPVVEVFPRWVQDKIRLDFESELRGRTAFLAVFVAGMLTTVVGMAVGLQALLRSQYRDFLIHQAVGAGLIQVATRVMAFGLAAWSAPSLMLGLLGLSLVEGGRYIGVSYGWLVLFVVTVTVSVVFPLAWRVAHTDVLTGMREER